MWKDCTTRNAQPVKVLDVFPRAEALGNGDRIIGLVGSHDYRFLAAWKIDGAFGGMLNGDGGYSLDLVDVPPEWSQESFWAEQPNPMAAPEPKMTPDPYEVGLAARKAVLTELVAPIVKIIARGGRFQLDPGDVLLLLTILRDAGYAPPAEPPYDPLAPLKINPEYVISASGKENAVEQAEGA